MITVIIMLSERPSETLTPGVRSPRMINSAASASLGTLAAITARRVVTRCTVVIVNTGVNRLVSETREVPRTPPAWKGWSSAGLCRSTGADVD